MECELECVHCGEKCNTEFQEIFDDVGTELQLNALIEKHFNLRVSQELPKDQCVLCDQCVTRVIDLFDISEQIKDHCPDVDASEIDDFPENEDMSMDEINYPLHEVDTIESISTNLSQPCSYPETSVDGLDESLICDNNSNLKGNEFLKYNFVENVDGSVQSVTDLNAYAETVINSNLEELQLRIQNTCSLCDIVLENHQNLLIHIKDEHMDDSGHMACILDNCNKIFNCERYLARHVVLGHYKLSSISICGACPDCGLSYTNFMDFNKHSCCRTLKCRGTVINHCSICKMEFPTFRRFRFHMQFHLEKRRPKICLLCERFFSNAEEFYEHVHYFHEPEGSFICFKCDRFCTTKELFEAHMQRHNIEMKYKCHLCHKRFFQKHRLESHMESKHSNIDRFKCEFCNKILANKTNYRNHIKFHTPDAEVQVNVCSCCGLIGRERDDLQEHVENVNIDCFDAPIEEEILTVVYVCEYCDAIFKTQANLKDHRETGIHTDKIFHCPLCEATFDDLRKVCAHCQSHGFYEDWKKSFPLYRMYMCDVGDCERSYAKIISLNSHKSLKHKETRLICCKCNEKFQSKELLDKHSEKCQLNGKLVCQYCEKKCPTNMSLAVHIARSHNNKNVNCPTCKASFKDKKSLEAHIDFVHVQVECTFCNKMIKNKRNLRLHERVKHTNIKRYFCEHCGKGFYNKSDLEAHTKTKHSSIVYKCEKCSFSTNYKNSMDVHIAKHNNQFQFKCPVCDREFTRKSVMDLHVKRHQVQREFVCSDRILNGCNASFITTYLLKKHIKEKHSTDAKIQNATGTGTKRRYKRTTKIVKNQADKLELDESAIENMKVYLCYEDQEENLDCIIEENNSDDNMNCPEDFAVNNEYALQEYTIT